MCRVSKKSGCSRCSNLQCPLHDSRLQESERTLAESQTVYSFKFGTMHRVLGGFDCTSRHVIYVVTCLRCELQGVGECHDPVARLKDYIRAAQQTVQTSRCALEYHFQDQDHQLSDLSIQIVDGVPTYGHQSAGVKAVRVRLENIWIRRLIGDRNGGLNVRCQWHRSMAGGTASHPVVTL